MWVPPAWGLKFNSMSAASFFFCIIFIYFVLFCVELFKIRLSSGRDVAWIFGISSIVTLCYNVFVKYWQLIPKIVTMTSILRLTFDLLINLGALGRSPQEFPKKPWISKIDVDAADDGSSLGSGYHTNSLTYLPSAQKLQPSSISVRQAVRMKKKRKRTTKPLETAQRWWTIYRVLKRFDEFHNDHLIMKCWSEDIHLHNEMHIWRFHMLPTLVTALFLVSFSGRRNDAENWRQST
jgi:hypothetical protein